MAKALTGYLTTQAPDPHLRGDNARLRARVAELEQLVLRLSEENDRLVAVRAAELLDGPAGSFEQLQPV